LWKYKKRLLTLENNWNNNNNDSNNKHGSDTGIENKPVQESHELISRSTEIET
jgi:hypothetical protein